MSIKTSDEMTISTESETHPDYELPTTTPFLIAWLDEQPNFTEITYQQTTRRGQDQRDWRSRELTRDRTALVILPDDYSDCGRASHSSQPLVAQAFSKGNFPSHNVMEKDGRRAAQLYTRSTYKTGVNGPSTFSRRTGGQRPITEYECAHCEQTFSDLESGYRTSGLDEHLEDDHDIEIDTEGYGKSVSHKHYTKREGNWETESEINFAAYQFLDGSGMVEHYSTVAAIRTRHGVEIDNSQNYAKGRARLTRIADRDDPKLPLTSLQNLLEDEPEDIYEITEIKQTDLEADDFDRSYVPLPAKRQRARIALLSSGRAIAIFYDETAKDRSERYCGTILEPDEVAALRDPEDIYDMLIPTEVAAAQDQHDIVGSQDYGNPFSDSREGGVIVRQGEHFFIPMDEDFSPDTATYYRGSHYTGWKKSSLNFSEPDVTYVDGLQRSCDACGSTTWEVMDHSQTCLDCGHYHTEMPESKTLSNDAMVEYGFSIPDFDPDALGSHRPRDLAADDDGTLYVRGTVRHIDHDHNMISFENRWHKVATGTRDDVVVFDTSEPSRGSGRSGNAAGMRYD